MKTATRTLRNHLHFLIIVPLFIIVMTWPSFAYVFDTETYWLPNDGKDIYMKMWDAWYGGLALQGKADFFYTDLLFYPDGLSLVTHNFSLPQIIIQSGLQVFLPPPNAFNLSRLLLVFLTIASAYLYLVYLFRDRWIGLFGATVIGASGFVMARPQHPEIATLATLILALYFFHRAQVERRPGFMLLSGLFLGATAFVGLYVLVCLCISVALYILRFAISRWRQPSFWLGLSLFSLASAPFLFVRIYPLATEPALLEDALNQMANIEVQFDLIGNFINPRHPITKQFLTTESRLFLQDGGTRVFLGVLPLFLAVMAFAKGDNRRNKMFWLALTLCFFVLRLGSTLSVNGVIFENIFLPKFYLEKLAPQVFEAFYRVSDFHAGVLLPYAVLTCYGMSRLMQFTRFRYRRGLLVLCLGIVAFEYYQPPEPQIILPERFSFITWLQSQPNQEEIRLINLPMGRVSKIYGLYQTLSAYPHAEGITARRPPAAAFNFITQNLLLSNWRNGKIINCLPGNRDEFIAARNQLADDGFTHVLLHHHLIWREDIDANFVNVPAAYSDEFISIYHMEDLTKGCEMSTILGPGVSRHLSRIYESVVVPLNGSSILSMHPYQVANNEGTLRTYSAVLYNLHRFVPLNADDLSGTSKPNQEQQQSEPVSAVAANSIIVFVERLQSSSPGENESIRDWLNSRFKSCRRLHNADNVVIEYFLHLDFPCDLAITDQPFAVLYDNGIQLGNLLPIRNENSLDLYFLWKRLPEDSHSVSVQFFDSDGNKALGQDFVIGLEPVAHHRIEMSALQPGDYQVKMIVYNFETRISVPGTVIGADARFDRELEITGLTIE